MMIDDVRREWFLEDNANDTFERDKFYIKMTRYGGFDQSQVCSNSFHTEVNALKLLHVIKHEESYANKFFNSGWNSTRLRDFLESEYRNLETQRRMDLVVKNKQKVVSRIDAIRRNDRALEIIKRVTLGHVYSKAEFEAITNEWVNEVRKDYPELKMNHNSIKVLNEFCSREGLIWESARIKEGGKVIRKYVMRSF